MPASHLYAFKALKKPFVNFWNELAKKKSDLAHLCWDVGGNAHPPCAKQADCLPELTSK